MRGFKGHLCQKLLFMFLMLLPVLGFAQLGGMDSSFGSSGYDEQAVRSTYGIEQLKQEIVQADLRDREALHEIESTMSSQNGDHGFMEIETFRRTIQQRIDARKDDCFAAQIIPHVRTQFEAYCGIDQIQEKCGLVSGSAPPDQSARYIAQASELDASLNQATRQARDTASSSWRTTAQNTVEQLSGHLNQLVQANQQCSQALAQAQSSDCRNIMDEHLGTQYQQKRELLIANCTPNGIENLIRSFSSYMTGDSGPAVVVSSNAGQHIQNRTRAIELLQALFDLNHVLKLSSVRPEARPQRPNRQ